MQTKIVYKETFYKASACNSIVRSNTFQDTCNTHNRKTTIRPLKVIGGKAHILSTQKQAIRKIISNLQHVIKGFYT